MKISDRPKDEYNGLNINMLQFNRITENPA